MSLFSAKPLRLRPRIPAYPQEVVESMAAVSGEASPDMTSTSRVMFVGDSITVGLVGYAQKKTDGSSFRGQASKALRWHGTGPFKDPSGLQHCGIGGATTYTFTEPGNSGNKLINDSGGTGDHSWVVLYSPEIVHLMLGVNDIISMSKGVGDTSAKIYDRLMGLAGSIVWGQRSHVGKNGYVLLSSICESLLPGEEVAAARELNKLILSTDEGNSTYKIKGVDSAGLFNAAIAKEGVKKYTVDGTHPNQAGYDLISDALITAMRPRDAANAGASASLGSRLVATAAIGAGGYALGRAFRWW